MPRNSDINFGVEIETVFAMDPDIPDTFPDCDDFWPFCATQGQIYVDQLGPELESRLWSIGDDYRQWQFSRDLTIEDGVIKPSDHAVPLEIKSRVFSYDSSNE
ncbi:hypothetical protein PG996_007355 [Apiospora saccharicola]|uniref:Restriction endonuclease domain-containing protein n=1 Tax=Apiospora saccharicola TaxID=335842 RepID=A0ABR1VAP3_9PEZI